jgi:SpoVK/Ycf46/Vps4 family AAA+-type ATPase
MEFELSPGETAQLPSFCGYLGPIGVVLGQEGGLAPESAPGAVHLTIPLPDLEQRRRHFSRAFASRRCADIDRISQTFHLPGQIIHQVARVACVEASLDGRAAVTFEDVRSASRTINRQLLDTLAEPVATWGRWTDLVTSTTASDKLRELERRCRTREALGTRLGRAFGEKSHQGVRALFTGPSGTGKTMGARVLASELGMDLYRVDLGSIVNKYIGETEKNLSRLLNRAESLDVVLLLDEGDSLLGHRTQVNSSNDRYANLETNYLLQRLENYQGIIVVTTNLGDQIDQAFQRRMDVVVPFAPPGASERLRIWESHLPETHQVPPPHLLRVANRCRLTGGQIRNAVLLGALMALDDGDQALSANHLEAGLRAEYAKAGATFPLQSSRPPQELDDHLAAFHAALTAQGGTSIGMK